MSKQVKTDVECPVCTYLWSTKLIKPTLSKASVFIKECPECESEILIKAITAGGNQCLLKVLDIKVSETGRELFKIRTEKAKEQNETIGNDIIQSNGK